MGQTGFEHRFSDETKNWVDVHSPELWSVVFSVVQGDAEKQECPHQPSCSLHVWHLAFKVVDSILLFSSKLLYLRLNNHATFIFNWSHQIF